MTLFYIQGMSQTSSKQEEKEGVKKMRLIDFNFAYNLPGGDLSDRFGAFNEVGVGLGHLNKSNLIFELRAYFQFGTKVKEDVLNQLRNDLGEISGTDGLLGIVLLRKRGVRFNFNFGKVFNFKADSRSGIKATVGLGFMQHKVRVQDDGRSLPQILRDYQYGYDRKTQGLAFNQFIGYQFVGNNQRLNFFTGLEFTQGLTKNIRSFNFGSTEDTTQRRFDMIAGFKVGFILAFYQFDSPDEIFY